MNNIETVNDFNNKNKKKACLFSFIDKKWIYFRINSVLFLICVTSTYFFPLKYLLDILYNMLKILIKSINQLVIQSQSQ